MINEDKQQQAIDYVLGEMSATDATSFERELSQDSELQAFTREMLETLGRIGGGVEALAHPPLIPQRILHTEVRKVVVRFPFIPWAVAACLAIGCVVLAAMWTESRKEIAKLEQRDLLSRIRIAALQSQVDAYAKTSAIVVWNPDRQNGVLQFERLPALPANQDYQMWVIDPKQPQPVSAGLVPKSIDQERHVTFWPTKPVGASPKFAVSIEPAGGSATPRGQIVLAGQYGE
jgi:anti-sigma-K factor RskA